MIQYNSVLQHYFCLNLAWIFACSCDKPSINRVWWYYKNMFLFSAWNCGPYAYPKVVKDSWSLIIPLSALLNYSLYYVPKDCWLVFSNEKMRKTVSIITLIDVIAKSIFSRTFCIRFFDKLLTSLDDIYILQIFVIG